MSDIRTPPILFYLDARYKVCIKICISPARYGAKWISLAGEILCGDDVGWWMVVGGGWGDVTEAGSGPVLREVSGSRSGVRVVGDC